MAFDHLKLLKDSEKFVKCTDGPIGEHIEQITASHAIAVSIFIRTKTKHRTFKAIYAFDAFVVIGNARGCIRRHYILCVFGD